MICLTPALCIVSSILIHIFQVFSSVLYWASHCNYHSAKALLFCNSFEAIRTENVTAESVVASTVDTGKTQRRWAEDMKVLLWTQWYVCQAVLWMWSCNLIAIFHYDHRLVLKYNYIACSMCSLPHQVKMSSLPVHKWGAHRMKRLRQLALLKECSVTVLLVLMQGLTSRQDSSAHQMCGLIENVSAACPVDIFCYFSFENPRMCYAI